MKSIISPKGFLMWGGIALVLLAVLGYVGILGPTAEGSIFGATWYFDNAENIAHLVLGIVALGAMFVLPANLQKMLVLLVGVIAVLVGLYSLVFSTMLLGANLENPADSILHLVVGAWGVWAGMKKGGMMASSMPSGMGGGMGGM